jgi:hypothetical protein
VGAAWLHFLAVTSADGTVKVSDQRYLAIALAIAKPALPFAARAS